MSIVGYYHANERHDGAELGNTAKKNGDHIFRYFPRAAVLLLDNTKLAGLPKSKAWDPALQIFEEKAYLFGVDCKGKEDVLFSIEDSLKELSQLADAASLSVVGLTSQK
ncbi:hypothetical protein J5N97_003903 [Dioscorea zingiberensis]|uniref:Uncharacterized protein n=1 Tax=Dioscorea zingiberensis TaxID=325984 RepID=A0A9D5HRM1_9LILI|nr:hypothetical protein J5N97_003903 [Dioscorea zingiberensis]